MSRWNPGDGITDEQRASGQRAVAIVTAVLHALEFHPNGSVTLEDSATGDITGIVEDLSEAELRLTIYSLASLAVGAMRSAQTQSGGLLGLPLFGGFAPDDWLKQFGMNLTVAPDAGGGGVQ